MVFFSHFLCSYHITCNLLILIRLLKLLVDQSFYIFLLALWSRPWHYWSKVSWRLVTLIFTFVFTYFPHNCFLWCASVLELPIETVQRRIVYLRWVLAVKKKATTVLRIFAIFKTFLVRLKQLPFLLAESFSFPSCFVCNSFGCANVWNGVLRVCLKLF